MKKQSISISPAPLPEDALRVGSFDLLPTVNKPPVITSHPARNFQQLTWARVVIQDNKPTPRLIDIKINPKGYAVRKGTAISWGLYCIDPSNVNNINDVSNLTFIWKRDGFPLYQYNRQNNGFGVEQIQFTATECTQELDGVYTCEVSNEFGTTTSAPFRLEVYDLDNSDLLYTNLLSNGDGLGGIDGWTNPDGLITPIVSNYRNVNNPSTITGYPGTNLNIGTGDSYNAPLPWAHMTNIDDTQLFYLGYKTYLESNKETLTDLTIPTSNLTPFPDSLKWMNTSLRVPIIPNEDFGKGPSRMQGFYPGVGYMDKYNKNTTGKQKIRFQSEFKHSPLTYFGRKNIKFEEDSTTTFTQTVSIADLENLTEGQVGGVDFLTAQFFAYVGNAISRYTIRCIVGGEQVDYDYYMFAYQDINEYIYQLEGHTIARIFPDPGTPIEVIPHADDSTTVTVEALDELNNVVNTKVFKGPTALDVWSIKEKADWSLTLYPIFAFMNNNNNPIKVFGQVYTNTNGLAPLFKQERNGTGMLGPTNLEYLHTGIDILTDINAKFIVQRYGQVYREWNKPYPRSSWQSRPGDFWYETGIDSDIKEKAYMDKGASAFFGIGGEIVLPSKTKQLRVRVDFTNSSPGRLDTNPSSKIGTNSYISPGSGGGSAFTDNEIYNTIYDMGGTKGNKPGGQQVTPYFKYGTPRCGITKMKLVIVPNGDVASQKHTSYALPPQSNTTLGLAKQAALSIGNDATTKSEFMYKLYQPDGVPPTPNPEILSADIEELREQYADVIETGQTEAQLEFETPNQTAEDRQADRDFAKESVTVEDQRSSEAGNPEATSSLNLQ